ncbi:MAG TPA: DEAD/DEAH box helicase [Vicinamibacterales bacterium]|jgi:ATP-dependent RNA helicase RhlE|nr:DEAD/DEAH box helicase [Vicinamibacterales bacterium]
MQAPHRPQATDRPQAAYDPEPVPFSSLGLEPSLLEGIAIRGFDKTTPIQSAVIPIALDGHDVIGCADTGTGKTVAFVLPILNRLLKARTKNPADIGVTRVLILAPTRELCVQIEDDIQGFTYHTELTSIAVYGGVGMDAQERALRAGADIVVATPGRLMDHQRSGAVNFTRVETFVLDEADRMMDMGFWPDVCRIANTLPPKEKRQTLLFSATMPDEVMKLLDEVVRDPKYVQVGSAGRPAQSITHTTENVPSAQKTEWLAKFLRRTQGPVLVFSRTKSGAERLARKLSSMGIRAVALHADRTQQQRSAAVEGFRGGQYHVLVATDVAARGLDIDGITHVVNFEVPSSREMYVHRVGRTGRAAMTGTALTLVAPEEARALEALQRSFGPELQG